MTSSIGFQFFLVLFLILINGVFAMYELAMVSARKIRLQQRAEDGDNSAKTALDLIEHPNRLLSTVQIGITLVGIFSGALGGATLAEHFTPLIAKIPLLEPYSEGIALVLVVLTITYLSLVVGELIPKRLALSDPEKIAAALAIPMKGLSKLASPMVWLLSVSTDLGVRLLGVKPNKEPPITEEEIKLLIEQGTQVGVFEEAEQDIVHSVFRLGDRRVDQIMTPHTEIVWLDLDDPLDENIQKALDSRFTRFPVGQGSLDNVQGILLSKDLFVERLKGNKIDLKSMLHSPLYVPESMPALTALEEIRNSGLLIALVVDEFGGILGMVTLLDILKAIVGEIPRRGSDQEPLIVQRADGSWLVDGLLQVDELKDILNLDMLPEEARVGYQTLGGLMMSRLGNIPSAGQYFDWEGIRFEVVDMDERRVDKVMITPADLLKSEKTRSGEEIQKE